MKTKEWMDFWLANCKKNTVKYHTYVQYRDIAALHLVPAFGEYGLNELTAEKIQIFLAEKRRRGNLRTGAGLSGRSVNLLFGVLKNALDCAVRFGHISVNPCSRAVRVKEENRETAVFSRAEQRKIERICMEKGGIYTGIVLCLHTGIRIGELLSLTWRDVDFRSNLLRVEKTVVRLRAEDGGYTDYIDRPKSPSSRRAIPLSPKAAEALKEMKKHVGGEYVFCGRKGRVSVRAYQHRFENLLRKNNIRVLHFHALRHTFATRVMECGVDVKTLSELLGHKNAAITLNRYAHSMMDTKRKSLRRMEKYIGM